MSGALFRGDEEEALFDRELQREGPDKPTRGKLVFDQRSAAKGVRVLAIAPGLFHTPMAAEVPPEVALAITSDAIFPRRFGAPENCADLCLSMIRTPMLNGEVIRLEAGVRLRAR